MKNSANKCTKKTLSPSAKVSTNDADQQRRPRINKLTNVFDFLSTRTDRLAFPHMRGEKKGRFDHAFLRRAHVDRIRFLGGQRRHGAEDSTESRCNSVKLTRYREAIGVPQLVHRGREVGIIPYAYESGLFTSRPLSICPELSNSSLSKLSVASSSYGYKG